MQQYVPSLEQINSIHGPFKDFVTHLQVDHWI